MLDLFETSWRDLWGDAAEAEPVGAVFTRPEIVALILDLAGYAPSAGRLAAKRVLEPSCGDGAFVAEVVARLVESERQYCQLDGWDDAVLDDALRAADISESALVAARHIIRERLVAGGCPVHRAKELSDKWTVHTDFLVANWPDRFDLIAGNPPYVRIEALPRRVLQRYRARYRTLTDRADIYVAFFERGLELLAPDGVLAFICANRFTKNQYGAALRSLIAEGYRVRYYVNLEHTQPFLTEVSAYPAILVIDRHRGGPTLAVTLGDIEPATLGQLHADAEKNGRARHSGPRAILSRFDRWYPEGGPWTTTRDDEHAAIARINARYPTLEESAPGTKVGIGVATGADRVFILKGKHPDIEEDRQLPMLMASNVSNQEIDWSGRYLINPFDEADDGSLVDLKEYPGLALYLEAHAAQLRSRHVAKSRPRAWYRTIDRVWPALRHTPKLVIPDIQASTVIGYDEGRYYPHHNLYWITSNTWDLLALKTLLRSTVVFDQVRAYSVQMRGGSLRYQAQTLRRVRVPPLSSLSADLVQRLAAAHAHDDQAVIDATATEAFNR